MTSNAAAGTATRGSAARRRTPENPSAPSCERPAWTLPFVATSPCCSARTAAANPFPTKVSLAMAEPTINPVAWASTVWMGGVRRRGAGWTWANAVKLARPFATLVNVLAAFADPWVTASGRLVSLSAPVGWCASTRRAKRLQTGVTVPDVTMPRSATADSVIAISASTAMLEAAVFPVATSAGPAPSSPQSSNVDRIRPLALQS